MKPRNRPHALLLRAMKDLNASKSLYLDYLEESECGAENSMMLLQQSAEKHLKSMIESNGHDSYAKKHDMSALFEKLDASYGQTPNEWKEIIAIEFYTTEARYDVDEEGMSKDEYLQYANIVESIGNVALHELANKQFINHTEKLRLEQEYKKIELVSEQIAITNDKSGEK